MAKSTKTEQDRPTLTSLVEDLPVKPFEMNDGIAYGPIGWATRTRKTNHHDKLNIAYAVSLEVTLVANNLKVFSRYSGVRLENWFYASSSY